MLILDETNPKSRKEHRCNFCSDVILKGEVYNRQKIFYEGSFYDWKTHERCSAIARKLGMYSHGGYDGVSQELFNTFIREEYQDLMISIGILRSGGYKSPPFEEQLEYVLSHHLINQESC